MCTFLSRPLWALALLLPFGSRAQTQTPDISIDALQIPNTPAFSLMDLAPSTIDEPKTPADFAVSLRNATNDFTTLPQSYGIEFAPAWMWRRDRIDFREFRKNELGPNIWQSLTISAGINRLENSDDAETATPVTQLGIGLKMSLVRGKVESTYQEINRFYGALGNLNTVLVASVAARDTTDEVLRALTASMDSLRRLPNLRDNEARLNSLGQQRAARHSFLANDAGIRDSSIQYQTALNNLRTQTEGLKLNRRGFKLDWAAGLVTDFYGQFDNSRVTRVGSWLTGGWALKPNQSKAELSLLGVTRVLYSPHQQIDPTAAAPEDNAYFDYGARAILHGVKNLGFSAEILGRVPLNNKDLEPTYRFAVNVDYQIDKNMVLSFQIGKNFDGPVETGGNLIAALQLFTSFGRRKFQNGQMQ